ncbi:MAG TPA: plastocyanin/azurin family copper-binding protein [Solirubrobacteraceae bacterium]
MAYSTTSLAANAGKVTIDFSNDSPLPHNLTIASTSGKVLGATPTFHGGLRAVTLDLGPGTYAFYCSVPGHRAAGMQGVLVVK